jgi:tetratricopeptide (TPR) repeat protein
MQKLPIAIALASLMTITTVAAAQQNEKPAGGTPSEQAAVDHSSPASQPQQSPPKIPILSKQPEDIEFAKVLHRAFQPSDEARAQADKLFEEGDLVRAEFWCRRALTLLPLFKGKPWYGSEVPLLGDILMAQGRPEEALECYLRDVANQELDGSTKPADPDHPRPNLNVALACCRLGDLEMAKKYFPDAVIAERVSPEWLKESPDIGDLRTREASLLWIRGNQESSFPLKRLRYFEAAAKLAPKNWMIAREIGDRLYDLNRYEKAIAAYRRAMELGGDTDGWGNPLHIVIENLQRRQKQQQKAAK